jgi:hypothetical protein
VSAQLAHRAVRLAALAAIAAVVVLGVLSWQSSVYGAAIAADGLEAARDTTRRVLVHAAHDRAVWQRRAVQVRIQRDSIDRELGLVSTARANLELRVARLEASASAPVTADAGDSVRTGVFHVLHSPFDVRAAASLPRPPATGHLDLSVELEAARIQVRAGCGPAGVAGVRPAQLTAIGPPWLTLVLDSVQQDPEVCSPAPFVLPSLHLGLPRSWVLLALAGGSFIAGVVVGAH